MSPSVSFLEIEYVLLSLFILYHTLVFISSMVVYYRTPLFLLLLLYVFSFTVRFSFSCFSVLTDLHYVAESFIGDVCMYVFLCSLIIALSFVGVVALNTALYVYVWLLIPSSNMTFHDIKHLLLFVIRSWFSHPFGSTWEFMSFCSNGPGVQVLIPLLVWCPYLLCWLVSSSVDATLPNYIVYFTERPWDTFPFTVGSPDSTSSSGSLGTGGPSLNSFWHHYLNNGRSSGQPGVEYNINRIHPGVYSSLEALRRERGRLTGDVRQVLTYPVVESTVHSSNVDVFTVPNNVSVDPYRGDCPFSTVVHDHVSVILAQASIDCPNRANPCYFLPYEVHAWRPVSNTNFYWRMCPVCMELTILGRHGLEYVVDDYMLNPPTLDNGAYCDLQFDLDQ